MSDASKPEEQQTAAAPVVSDAEEEETHAPAHDVTATTVSGSRVRRSTQKFTVDEPKADDADEFQPPVGKGQKIKDIALVNDIVAALGKKQAEILKALYLAMYGRRFQLKNLKVIKEHILEFSGIPEQDDKAREVLFNKLARWKRGFVQEVMDVLGVDRSKKSFDDEEKTFDKDSLVNRLIDWLHNPQEKKGGRKPSTPKSAAKKTKKAETAKTPAAKRKRTTKETTAASKKKQKTTKKSKAAAESQDEDDNNEDEEEEKSDDSGDESASDFDESEKKKPAKKKKAVAAKKKSPVAKRAPRKPKFSKPIESDDDDESNNNKDGDEKEDEKPETKSKSKSAKNSKAKSNKEDKEDKDDKSESSSSALDADVKAKVKQIIEQGNAEELTVKKIVRQVSEELGRDLSGEKNAIKEFIKAGHQPFADIKHIDIPRAIDRSIMGSKRSKKTTTTTTTTMAADAAAPAPDASPSPAKTTKAAPAAAAPKQEANALADMFAQSSVLFAKKASYVQAGAAPKKKVAEAAEQVSSVASGKRKRSAADGSSSGKTQEEYDAEDAADELAAHAEMKKQLKLKVTEEEGDKPAKKQKKKKHKKLAQEAAAAAAAAAAGTSADATTEEAAASAATTESAEPSKDTATDEEKSQRSIFVGNVSLDATQKDLKTFFSQCGRVESVRLRFMPIAGCAVDQAGNQKLMMKVCANKKILSDSKDNCNAYVTFAEQKSVEKALQLNGATFMLMKIRVDHENPVVDPKRSVFVGNVGFNVSDEKMRKFFEKRLKSDEEPNPVENVRIIRDRATGMGKGFGYVLLKNATLAGKALSLHETSLDSRPIRVQVCGKRFKNKKGEEDEAKKKHEGVRASAGAKTRVALKRKASGKPLPDKTSKKKVVVATASSSSSMKPKPKHVARKALQGKDGGIDFMASGAAKRAFKKASGAAVAAGGKDKKKLGSKKSSGGDRTPKPKVKKPKHAARKARQAAEAAAAGK